MSLFLITERMTSTQVTGDSKTPINGRAPINGGAPIGGKIPTSKDLQVPKVGLVCKHYIYGRCRFGFSGQKADDSGNVCRFAHPKVCEKLYKHGINKERGCQGKKSGCQDFHPELCRTSFKGECEKDCEKGFHLKSIIKMGKALKRKQYPKD